MSHIFISYARKDANFVQMLRVDLEKNNISYWIDTESLSLGTFSWEKAIRKAIVESYAVLWIVSPASFDSAYVRDEIAIAKMYNTIIYPLWVDGEKWLECVPIGTGEIQNIDLRNDRYESGFASVLTVLKTKEQSIAVPQDETPHPISDENRRNPYKGLIAFRQNDSNDFFGREQLVNRIVKGLDTRLSGKDDRFLAILGPSGAGKSSVVMAGVLPALKNNAISGSDSWFQLPVVLPGNKPIESLAGSLSKVLQDSSDDEVKTQLTRSDSSGLSYLANELPGKQVILYIDQFEELFTLTEDNDERQKFIDLITHAVTEPDGKLIVILTMRADFFGHPLHYPVLGNLMRDNNESVLPLTISELRDAIARPALLPDVSLSFDDGLIAEIVFALRDGDRALKGALPLLQFTLERLYAERDSANLTLDAYRSMGGVHGALGTHCEAIFEALPERMQASLAEVFLPLVNIDPDSGEATRRRARSSEITGGNEAKKLVKTLIDNRLLQTGQDTTGAYVEIAHEALIRTWDRLVQWIQSVKEDLRLLEQVKRAAHEWDKNNRSDAYVWQEERLQPVYAMLQRLSPAIDRITVDFLRPESTRLLEQFKNTALDYEQRSIIARLKRIGISGLSALIQIFQNHEQILANTVQTDLENAIVTFKGNAIPRLLPHLKHENAIVIQRTIKVLARLKPENFGSHIIPLLSHVNRDVRRVVAENLAATKLGEQNIMDVAYKYLDEQDHTVKAVLLGLLGTLAVLNKYDYLPVDVLLDISKQPLRTVEEKRQIADRICEKISISEENHHSVGFVLTYGSWFTKEKMISRLKDVRIQPHDSIFYQVIVAFGNERNREIRDTLMQYINSIDSNWNPENYDFPSAGSFNVAQFKQDKNITMLISIMYTHESAYVRKDAAKALRSFKDATADAAVDDYIKNNF